MGDAIDRDDVLAFINSDHEMTLNELRDGIRALPTAPPAASEVAEAIEALEFTRWQPTGDLAVWSKTDDGRNHTRVMHAIGLLRGIVATPPTTPGERGEAVEALLRRVDEALEREFVIQHVDADGKTTPSDLISETEVRALATALRESERLRKAEVVQRDAQWAKRKAAESDRDALRAALAEATAVADIFRAMAEKCPACGKLHAADTLIWAQKPHSIHQCVKDVFGDGCGATWLDRNAKHALRKVAKALSADLLDEETPEQFGERMREVLDLHVGEHALADERATEATARAERAEAQRDALRATFGLNSTNDWMRLAEAITYCLPGDFTKLPAPKHLLSQLAETRRQADEKAWEDVKRENLRAIEAEDKLRAAETALTAEREAHEETRATVRDRDAAIANWKRATDTQAERADRLQRLYEAEVKARMAARADAEAGRKERDEQRVRAEAAEAQLATLEAAPDLGEAFIEECAQAAYSAHFGNAPMKVGDTRPAWRAGARAVLEMAAKRWGRATALGEAREDEEAPAGGAFTSATVEMWAKKVGDVDSFYGAAFGVVAEAVKRLEDEVSRLRGRR